MRNDRIRMIIEIILLIIITIMVTFLIWNHNNYLDEKTILESKYDFNVIKLETTENTITRTEFLYNQDLVKYETIYYLEDGVCLELVEKKYYSSINKAKEYYDGWVNNENTIIDSVLIEKNIVTIVNENPEFYDEEVNLLKYDSNKGFIDRVVKYFKSTEDSNRYNGYLVIYDLK